MTFLPISRAFTLACLLVFLTIFATACTTRTEPEHTEASAAALDAHHGQAWLDLVAAAQAEGELVLLMNSGVHRILEPVLNAFSDKYGIRVSSTKGAGFSLATRTLAERSRGRYSADLVRVGDTSMEMLRSAGALAPMEPWLILPEVTNRADNWLLDYYPWTDASKRYAMGQAVELNHNITDIYFNTDAVPEAEIASISSWQDLLHPRWRGRIVIILDPKHRGKMVATVRLLETLGHDWAEQLVANNNPTMLPASSATLLADGMARGKYHVAILAGAANSHMNEMIEQGLPISKLERTLKEGGLVEISGAFAVLDSAPNPNATRLFLNWFMSQEGQSAVHRLVDPRFVRLSLRTDVPQGAVSDQDWAWMKSLKPEDIVVEDYENWPQRIERQLEFMDRLARKYSKYQYQQTNN